MKGCWAEPMHAHAATCQGTTADSLPTVTLLFEGYQAEHLDAHAGCTVCSACRDNAWSYNTTLSELATHVLVLL